MTIYIPWVITQQGKKRGGDCIVGFRSSAFERIKEWASETPIKEAYIDTLTQSEDASGHIVYSKCLHREDLTEYFHTQKWFEIWEYDTSLYNVFETEEKVVEIVNELNEKYGNKNHFSYFSLDPIPLDLIKNIHGLDERR